MFVFCTLCGGMCRACIPGKEQPEQRVDTPMSLVCLEDPQKDPSSLDGSVPHSPLQRAPLECERRCGGGESRQKGLFPDIGSPGDPGL